jgi:hypothetical protein
MGGDTDEHLDGGGSPNPTADLPGADREDFTGV